MFFDLFDLVATSNQQRQIKEFLMKVVGGGQEEGGMGGPEL